MSTFSLAIGAVILTLLAGLFVRRRRLHKQAVAENPFKVVRGAFDDLYRDKLGDPIDVERELTALALNQDSLVTRNYETNNLVTYENGVERALGKYAPVIADAGLIPAGEMLIRWHGVDEHVFNALRHITHEKIDNVADMLRVLNERDYAIESDGFFEFLKGHVGESHVQSHLLEAGYGVSMPYAPNHPEADLYIDGVGTNVKTVSDALKALKDHQLHYDSPIIVPHDAANIPEHGVLNFDPSHGTADLANLAEHKGMIVDHALSLHNVSEQTSHALDVAHSPAPAFRFPWITATISTLREADLLLRGQTDGIRAAKNVATDVLATSGGAISGAKIGGFVGAVMAGPIGAPIGGFVGGILGAIGGKMAGDKVKRQPLEAAKANYERAYSSLQSKSEQLNKEAGERYLNSLENERQKLQDLSTKLKNDMETLIAESKSNLDSARLLNRTQALAVLNAAEEEMRAEANSVKQEHGGYHIGMEIIHPDTYVKVKSFELGLLKWTNEKNIVLQRFEKTPQCTSDVFDLAVVSKCGKLIAHEFVQETKANRFKAIAAIQTNLKHASQIIVKGRADAIGRVKDTFTKVTNEIERTLQPLIHHMRVASSDLESELGKAGLKKAS